MVPVTPRRSFFRYFARDRFLLFPRFSLRGGFVFSLRSQDLFRYVTSGLHRRYIFIHRTCL